jgi:Spy/CpxP family protein refolding chaperone
MGKQNAEMHLDHLAAVLTKIGASESQKSQVAGLMRPAFAEMKSVHDSHSAAFAQFHELLFAPSLDRGKMESLRAEQIRSFDEATRRVTSAFADAAEVLSPEQRSALAAEIRRHHGG